MTAMTRRELACLAVAHPVLAAGTKTPPALFLPHGTRQFIGQSVLEVMPGEFWMVAPFGRPPVNFDQLAPHDHMPSVYISRDEGRTWRKGPKVALDWSVGGYISDGGISLIRLRSGKLMLTVHRHVPEYHGGGIPAISFSSDRGRSWSPARLVDRQERVCYVMNERTIQLKSGRIAIPVAIRGTEGGAYREGDACDGACYLSDDGERWRLSQRVTLNDLRGMAEPAIAELRDGRLLMLARTGSGSHHASWSSDGGETWSQPQPTTLTAACSPLTLKATPDGRLVVAYNPAKPLFPSSFFPRRPLAYSVSGDDGRSWGPPVVIDDAPNRQMIYPSITFLKDGVLFVYSEHFAREDGRFNSAQDKGAARVGGGRRRIMPYLAR